MLLKCGYCPSLCVQQVNAYSFVSRWSTCLQQQGARTVFQSDTMLRSDLVRPKDVLYSSKQDGAV